MRIYSSLPLWIDKIVFSYKIRDFERGFNEVKTGEELTTQDYDFRVTIPLHLELDHTYTDVSNTFMFLT